MADNGQIFLLTDKGIEEITPFVGRFVYRNSLLAGRVRWKLHFDSSQWDFWKNFMIGNGLQFQVQVVAVKNGTTVKSQWLSLVVDQSAGDLRSTQLRGRIEGGGIELDMMNEERRKGYVNTTASQIIQQIAAQYKLTPDIQATSAINSWWQANKTDWAFLQELMSDYIPSVSNSGDAYLNIDAQKLVVKSINFGSPSVRQFDLTESDDRVPSVSFRYYGGQVSRAGVIVEARGFDRSTGTPVTFTSSPTTAATAALADKLPQSLALKKKVVICSSGDMATVRATALRAQAQYAPRYYGLAIRVLNDLTIRLRDMIEISAKDDEGAGAFVEGRYAVYEYQITYSSSRIVTTIIGYRQESYAGPQVATGAPASQSMGTDQYKLGQANKQTVAKRAVPLG